MPPPRGKGRFSKDKRPKRNNQSLLFRRKRFCRFTVAGVTEIETGFRFNDAVLRHLTVAKAKAETNPSIMMKAVEREEARKERQEASA